MGHGSCLLFHFSYRKSLWNFVYYSSSQKSAVLVFIGNLLQAEKFFARSHNLFGVVNNSDFWDKDPVYYFTSLLQNVSSKNTRCGGGVWVNADGKCFNSWNQIRWFSELLSANILLKHIHDWFYIYRDARMTLKKVKKVDLILFLGFFIVVTIVTKSLALEMKENYRVKMNRITIQLIYHC